MFFYNLRLVFRNLIKNKLYSILSITGFAIGFAVCIVIGLFAYNEYTVDNCYPNHSRIYRLVNEKKKKSEIDYNISKLLSENNPDILAICQLDVMMNTKFSVKIDKNVSYSSSLGVTNNSFFEIFSIKVIKGIPKSPFAGKETAVLTKSFAQKLFKQNEEPIGRVINIDNFITATISAVVEDFPENSSFNASILLNIENENFRFSTACETNDNCINPINHFLVIDERANPVELADKLNKNISTYSFAIDSIGLQPLHEIYLDKTITDCQNLKGSRITIFIFIAIGFLIILLSTINYLNYNISQQYYKLREIGIKRINGAGFNHLIKYYLTEVIVGIIISVDVALILVALMLPQINSLLGKQLVLDGLLSPYMLFVSAGIIVIIIIVNSIVPFYLLARFSNNLFSGRKQAKGKLVGSSFLTVFQFTATIILIVSVLIIQKQMSFVQSANLGFNKEHLLKLSLPYNFNQQQVLKQELNKLPFVVGSTLSHGTPGEINFWMGSGDSSKKGVYLATINVDSDFNKIIGIDIVDGRWFLSGDIGKACIMNQEAFKLFEWKNIDNKRYNNGREGGYEVVGVVKNFNFESHHKPITPACLLSCSPERYYELHNLSIRITPGEVESKLKQIEQVWKKIIPDDPMEFTFYDTMFDAMYRKEKLLAVIIMFFSVIAIVLSCMGILGQVFQTCINRTKEIGIRKVNGASTWTIIGMLNLDFVKLIVIAFVIACLLSYYIMNRWLQNFAYKTSMNWWIFVLAGLVVLVISFITVSWHSWRTASRNPVEALKYE